MNTPCLHARLTFALAFSLTLVGLSLEAQITWDGGGGDDNWTTGDNWAGNVAPSGGNSLIFTGNIQTASTNTLANGSIIDGIQFTNDGSTSAASGEFVLSGNSVTLSSGITTTAVVPANTTLTDIVNFDIILNGNRTFTANGNAANNTEHNLILNGDISGAFQLLTAGDATITFAGNNTFTSFRLGDGGVSSWNGTTGTRAGFVVVSNNGALGTGLVTSRGGQLQAGVSGINLANDFKVSAGGLRVGGSNNFEISGAITQDASRDYANYGTGTVTLSGGLVLGTGQNANFTTGAWNFTGAISGGGNFRNTGGIKTFSANNTYTGTTEVTGGTLNLNASNNIADTGDIIQSAGTINVGDGVVETVNSYNATAGTLNFGGSSELVVSANSRISNVTIGTHGRITVGDGATLTQTGGAISALGDNDSFTFNMLGSSSANIAGTLNFGGNGQINKDGTGTVTVTNNNSNFGGGTRIRAGTLEFTSISNTDANSSLGRGGFQNILQIGSDSNSATLRMIGTNTTNSTNRNMQIGDMGGTVDVVEAAQTLAINGVVSGNGTTGNGALTKTGAGTLVLAGNNTWSGGATVSEGTLQIGNGGTSGTIGSGNVVNDATLIFNSTGSHSVADITGTGDTTISAGTLSLNGSNYTNDITIASVANVTGDGATTGALLFEGATHTITVDATTSGALGSIGAGSTDISSVGAGNFIVNTTGSGAGDVTVLRYGSGGFSGNIGSFALGANNSSVRGAGSFIDNGVDAITIDLGFVSNTWSGSASNNWDVGTTANWNNSSDTVFQQGDDVVFDDTATTNLTPTLQENITVGDLAFNNSTKAYTISSNATEALSVVGNVNASNGGDVTVNSDVNVTGTINVNGSGSTIFNGSVTGSSGLTFDGSGDSTYFGGIAGSGDLIKNGSGTVRFQTVAPSFTGTQYVNEGTLLYFSNAINDNSNEANLTTIIAAGATLEFNTNGVGESIQTFDFGGGGTFKKSGGGQFNQVSSQSDITFSATGLVHVAGGEYQFGGGTPGNWSANLGSMQIDSGATFSARATSIWIDTLTGDGRFQVGGKGTNGTYGLTLGVSDGTGIFNGLIENDSGAGETQFTINKVGTGTQTLNGDNTYTGDTTISGGQLNINGTNVSSFFVGSGTNLGGEGSTSGDITFQGTTHTLDVNALTSAALGSTGTGTLDVSAVGTGGFTVNVSGVAGDVTVLTYGSGGFTGDLNAFSLGTSSTGSRGIGGFYNDTNDSAIKVDLGYADNTWTGSINSNWNLNDTANWNNSSDSIFLNLDDATFDDSANNFTPTLAADITASRVTFENNTNDYSLGNDNGSRVLTSNNGFDFTGSGNVTVNVELSGAAGLTQSGSGTTTISSTNSYTGTTTIGNGTIVANAASAFGTSGNITFTGGTLQFTENGTTANYGARIENSTGIIIDSNGQDVTLSGSIDSSNSGGLTKNGTGQLTITAARNYTGATTVNEGTLTLRGAAIGTSKSYAPIANGAILEFDSTGTGANGGTITLNGSGTFKKSGTNEFVQTSAGTNVAQSSGGLFHVAAGTYRFGAGGLGTWASNLGDMQIDAGATYQGRASHIIIDALNGDGTIGIGGTSAAASGVGLRLGVDNGTGVFGGTIQNTNGDGALFTLEKVGSGTQTLNGNNTYTGATTISGGLLNINGTNVSSITVAAGGNIGGEGATSGNIIFAGTTHTLAIDAGSSEALSTSGTLDVNAVSAGNLTVNATGSSSGSVTVLDYSGGVFSGNIDRFTLGSGASLRGAGSFVDSGSAITIDLGFETRTWAGSNNGVWDGNTTANWQEGDSLFVNGDNVIFDDTLTGNSLINLSGNIQAGSITFNNNSTAYTLDFDTDELSVMSGLVLSGNASATINTNVGTIVGGILASGAGDLVIGGNVSEIDDISVTGAGEFTLSAGSSISNLTGTLSLEGSGNGTLSGTIAGTGSLSKSGGGTAILNGANTFTGNTSISGGALVINASEVLSDSADVSLTGGNFRMVNGTTETVNSFRQTAGLVGFGFTATGSQSGSSRLNINGDSAFTNIQIGNAGTLGVAANVTATLTGSISQLGNNDSFSFDIAENGQANVSAAINTGKGNGQINKSGAGILRLTANNSQYGGGNRFTNGTVEFTSIVNAGTDQSSSLGDADFQDVLQIGSDATSATLRMTGTNGKNTSDRSVQIGDAGGSIEVADAAQILTLNGIITGNGTAGNGALTTGGAGTLVLAGNNAFTGGTTVTSGTLLVNNTAGSGTGTGAVVVNSNATIGGSGAIGGATTISGAHSAGGSLAKTSVAQQTLSGDLTYNSGATVSWDLIANSSSNPGTDFDQFAVGGALDFSGPTSIDLNFDGGTVDWTDSFWDADQTWTIFSGATSLTNANNLSILAEDWEDANGVLFSTARALPNEASFSIGASGNSIILTFNAVPEPSTFALTGLGLSAFGWVARKRRRKPATESIDGAS
ncbi:MAG: autotransporter-associated beta strand repeat-containing protein [Verrucomicrobiales bacterium]